jgi:hypothetical protein
MLRLTHTRRNMTIRKAASLTPPHRNRTSWIPGPSHLSDVDRRGRAQRFFGEILLIAACPLPNCPILVRYLKLPLAPLSNLSYLCEVLER